MRLHEVTALLDSWYDPAWADSWDSVGLVAGDPEAEVRRVLLAVDPAPAVVDEALEWGADLVVVHHPLYLRAVSSVAATAPKGRTLHRLLTGGVGSVGATLAGALLLGLIFNILNFENGLGWISLSAYWQSVIRGGFLLLVVILQSRLAAARSG